MDDDYYAEAAKVAGLMGRATRFLQRQICREVGLTEDVPSAPITVSAFGDATVYEYEPSPLFEMEEGEAEWLADYRRANAAK